MQILLSYILAGGILLFAFLLAMEIKKKNMHIWLWSYISTQNAKPQPGQPIHIMFAFCDHFEPRWGDASPQEEDHRVDRWCNEYPRLAAKHKDADGCYPKHSFFYPEEEYSPRHLEKIAKLCADGFGEIEIHIHHDNDTAEGLTATLRDFLKTLDQNHGAIPVDKDAGEYRFAFIHGNWALDNSRADGRWCGVNNELKVLRELGCYADFTLPSAPSDTQTAKINSLYYATGRDGQCKSHNTGVDVEVGKQGHGDLMIIQGPLRLNWRNRKFGLFPRIENSDIRRNSPPTLERINLWIKSAIQVKKQPNWIFVKIHTHGTQEGDMDTLLGEPTDQMFSYLETQFNDGDKYILHYVSAREMYNIVKAAEAGVSGSPNEFRDYVIPPPPLMDTPGNNSSD